MTAPRPSPAIMPRGLCRTQASAYIGVSPGLFDEMVRDGRMPLPRVVNARRVWDMREIDAAFDDLPHVETKLPDPQRPGHALPSNPLDQVGAIE